MGFWDFIFGKNHIIEDEFFGKMLYLTFKDTSKNYYECRRMFQPADSLIELGVEGDENGSSQIQKDFFSLIEKKYDEIIESIAPVIENEFRNWKEDFIIKDFKKEFKPVYMFLPRCEKQPIEWEMAFESEHDLNHQFSVTMNDMIAREVLIDG